MDLSEGCLSRIVKRNITSHFHNFNIEKSMLATRKMLILRRLYSRQSNSSRYARQTRVDPGIRHQREIVAKAQEDDSEIDFEELESDFMGLGKSHRDHLNEIEAWKEKEKYLIVKRKYFTEKYPNFLTWHDKEHIQYLHNSDPEEWSLEKLSEAFPALPEVIAKIIRNKWTKKTQAKIASHDRSVTQHWTDFKQGKLDSLPDDLKEHLQKFSTRSRSLKPFEIPNDKEKIITNREKNIKPGEFSEIITSYQQLQSKNASPNKSQMEDQPKYLNDNNTNNNDLLATIGTVRKDGTLLTFKELQRRVEKDIFKGKNVSEQEKLIIKETKVPSNEDLNTTVVLKPEDILSIVEHRREANSGTVGSVRKTTRDMSHLIYPDKIAIPSKQYRRGYTYKLNDCYYDSDGVFLYRVPGMG